MHQPRVEKVWEICGRLGSLTVEQRTFVADDVFLVKENICLGLIYLPVRNKNVNVSLIFDGSMIYQSIRCKMHR